MALTPFLRRDLREIRKKTLACKENNILQK